MERYRRNDIQITRTLFVNSVAGKPTKVLLYPALPDTGQSVECSVELNFVQPATGPECCPQQLHAARFCQNVWLITRHWNFLHFLSTKGQIIALRTATFAPVLVHCNPIHNLQEFFSYSISEHDFHASLSTPFELLSQPIFLWYSVRSANHKSFHHIIFSTLLLPRPSQPKIYSSAPYSQTP